MEEKESYDSWKEKHSIGGNVSKWSDSASKPSKEWMDWSAISVGSSAHLYNKTSVGDSLHRRLKERTILAIIIGLILIIAVIVAVVALMLLPKGGLVERTSKVDVEVTVQNMVYTEALKDKGSPEYLNFTEQFCDEIQLLYGTSDLKNIYKGCVVNDVRNGSLIVLFTIVFVSKEPPSGTSVRTVLTSSQNILESGQAETVLGGYLLDKGKIVLGEVTVIETNDNPVPRIAFDDSCTLNSSCKTKLAECINRRCVCPPSRYYRSQVDSCLLSDVSYGDKNGDCIEEDGLSIQCDKASKYRTPDGTCNNLDHPTWGSAMTPQLRRIPPMYDDGIDTPRQTSVDGTPLPSPRHISNLIFSSPDPPPRNTDLTMMTMQWGQFIDHEFVKTPTFKGEMGSKIQCCNETEIKRPYCFAIKIPGDDPYFNTTCMNFVRSLSAANRKCNPGWREQLNQVTSYIDGSAVYGSTLEETMSLRTGSHGLLKTEDYDLLPQSTSDVCVLKFPATDHCQKAGDDRVNVVPSLGWSHTAFLREHNRIAKKLYSINPHWSNEKIFQETRRLIAAFLQHITYTEYLAAFLNNYTLQKYSLISKQEGYADAYGKEINPSIANVFAAAAFRHGHSQIANYQATMDKQYLNFTSKERIEKTYMDPHMIERSQGIGLDGIARWLVDDPNPLTDRIFGDGVRNKLFEVTPGVSLDLAAVNIQRGRDHGLPSYNYWRRYCNLGTAESFEALNDHDNTSRALLKRVYRHVNDIDLYAGAMSEEHLPGSFLGPTFTCIMGEQFRNLKLGDRFWYENPDHMHKFTSDQLTEIKKISLARIMCDNFDIETIQPNVFKVPDGRNNKRVHCGVIPHVDLSKWKEPNPIK